MPCKPAKARHLLRDGKARVVRRTPFTIQLTIATGENVQSIHLGVDAGSKHIGLSATTEKEELFSSEVELRKDITDLLSSRREMRRARRNRKTRYRAPRFDNRVHAKNKGWLAPTLENKISAHLSRIKAIRAILPVSRITIEVASFDIQKIKNPEIEGEQYQQGEQLGFWNVREYVLFRDGHKCCHCHGKSKDPILNVHHIESRKTGGDAPNNLITLCETCHKAYHAGKIQLTSKRGKKFTDATHMGILRWELLKRAKEANLGIPVKATFGYITKTRRIQFGIAKTHCADAFCIAGNLNAKRLGEYLYQKQTRKHNRQIHKMAILKGGYRKRNQAPFEVFNFRLFDKVRFGGNVGFVFGRRTSGSFAVRTLFGEKLSEGVSYKKLSLLERRTTFLTQLVKEGAIPPVSKDTGFLARFL